MAHRLAVMAGELDVEEALRRIGTAEKFQRWCHYYEIEPFGAKRDNYHAAMVAKMMADMSGFKKQDGAAFSYEDLLLTFEERKQAPPPKRVQSVEDQLRILNILAMAYSGKGVDA